MLTIAGTVILRPFFPICKKAFQKWPQNYCICHTLQSGANFPEIAIGYGSPGISVILVCFRFFTKAFCQA